MQLPLCMAVPLYSECSHQIANGWSSKQNPNPNSLPTSMNISIFQQVYKYCPLGVQIATKDFTKFQLVAGWHSSTCQLLGHRNRCVTIAWLTMCSKPRTAVTAWYNGKKSLCPYHFRIEKICLQKFCHDDSKMEIRKWNYPNRKWNNFSLFQSSDEKTDFIKVPPLGPTIPN